MRRTLRSLLLSPTSNNWANLNKCRNVKTGRNLQKEAHIGRKIIILNNAYLYLGIIDQDHEREQINLLDPEPWGCQTNMETSLQTPRENKYPIKLLGFVAVVVSLSLRYKGSYSLNFRFLTYFVPNKFELIIHNCTKRNLQLYHLNTENY